MALNHMSMKCAVAYLQSPAKSLATTCQQHSAVALQAENWFSEIICQIAHSQYALPVVWRIRWRSLRRHRHRYSYSKFDFYIGRKRNKGNAVTSDEIRSEIRSNYQRPSVALYRNSIRCAIDCLQSPAKYVATTCQEHTAVALQAEK